MEKSFKLLDDELKKIRGLKGNYNMEVLSESTILDFYEKNSNINSNDLTNRLYRLKAFDEKFKLYILPIIITVFFGIAVTLSFQFLTNQYTDMVEPFGKLWEEASDNVIVTNENKEAFQELHDSYQKSRNLLYGAYIFLIIAVLVIVFILIAPIDLLYEWRIRAQVQKSYEIACLESILKQRKKDLKRICRFKSKARRNWRMP